MAKEEVRAEVLKMLLGKMSREEIESISEGLGILAGRIRSLKKWIME